MKQFIVAEPDKSKRFIVGEGFFNVLFVE